MIQSPTHIRVGLKSAGPQAVRWWEAAMARWRRGGAEEGFFFFKWRKSSAFVKSHWLSANMAASAPQPHVTSPGQMAASACRRRKERYLTRIISKSVPQPRVILQFCLPVWHVSHAHGGHSCFNYHAAKFFFFPLVVAIWKNFHIGTDQRGGTKYINIVLQGNFNFIKIFFSWVRERPVRVCRLNSLSFFSSKEHRVQIVLFQNKLN